MVARSVVPKAASMVGSRAVQMVVPKVVPKAASMVGLRAVQKAVPKVVPKAALKADNWVSHWVAQKAASTVDSRAGN